MTFWVAGAVVGSAVIGGMAAGDAASTQAASADRAADLQYKQYEQTRQDQMPWMEAGKTALNKLIPLTDYKNFSMSDFQADPGYSFRMSEGLKGLERSAAARGGLLSGSTLKGIQRFGQDLASQEYTNAFNRYQTERAARLQPLQSLAGVGQTTAQQIGQSGMQTAQNVGDIQMSGAAARASGYVGGANALTGALNTGLNYYQGQQMMNRLAPSGGGGGGYSWQTPNYGVGIDASSVQG
jgi:hypothetical protein